MPGVGLEGRNNIASNIANPESYHRVSQATYLEGDYESDNANNNQSSAQKNNKGSSSWEGKCIHIVVELAECGDVQHVSH